MNNIIRISYVNRSAIETALTESTIEAAINSAAVYEIEGMEVPATMETKEETQTGRQQFTTVLTFRCCGDLSDELYRRAFICETADGRQYLLGGVGRPYPTISQRLLHPSQRDASQLREVQVTWQTDYPPQRIE